MTSFNTLLFLFAGSLAMATSSYPVDKYQKTKRITKTYSVNSDVNAVIENSFGDVTVQTWDKNTVSIEVVVSVSGNDEARVDERLRAIDVAFTGSASRVSAKSEIPNEVSSGFLSLFSFGSSSKTNTRVDYMVKMPLNASLDVNNDYGAVIIEKMNAPLTLKCDFGRLQIGQLLNTQNKLSFDYTKNSNIDYMKGGTIKADFSAFHVYGADLIDFSGDYTTATFGPLKQIKYNSDFSTLKIERALSINGRGDYSKVAIKEFDETADLKASFGKLTINSISKGFKSLNIKADYTDIDLNYDKNVAFEYQLNTEFGSLKIGDNLKTLESRKDYNESYKKGYHLSANSGGLIEIKTSFGSVTLKSNN